MNNETLLKHEYYYNEKLYEFLAVNYDISDLARKIVAAKSSRTNLVTLKKIANGVV